MKIVKTGVFREWVDDLRDWRAKTKIAARIERMSEGNFGDARSIGQGLSELRINYGPGYRIYFTKVGQLVVILLCGGDKSTQTDDIAHARALVRELKE